jgi:hypothetical protein
MLLFTPPFKMLETLDFSFKGRGECERLRFNLLLIPSTTPLVVLFSKYPTISPNHRLIAKLAGGSFPRQTLLFEYFFYSKVMPFLTNPLIE